MTVSVQLYVYVYLKFVKGQGLPVGQCCPIFMTLWATEGIVLEAECHTSKLNSNDENFLKIINSTY